MRGYTAPKEKPPAPGEEERAVDSIVNYEGVMRSGMFYNHRIALGETKCGSQNINSNRTIA